MYLLFINGHESRRSNKWEAIPCEDEAAAFQIIKEWDIAGEHYVVPVFSLVQILRGFMMDEEDIEREDKQGGSEYRDE